MFKVFFEDLNEGDIAKFGSYKIEKEELIEFATKYDPQPFHLDEEAAKKSVFGSLCTSGWQTTAVMMRMLIDHVMETGMASMGSPGMDNLRWLKPVLVDDTLRCEMEMLSKSESKSKPHIGFVKMQIDVFNQNDIKIMTVTANSMIMRRPSES